MEDAVRGEDPRIAQETPSRREIEGISGKIRDRPPGLFDQQASRRLIPQCIVKLAMWREPDQQIARTGGDGDVLRLTVHRERRCEHSQGATHPAKSVWISVPGFE